ncbi:unnamed protein product, partial [Closterium sp. NIES-54]
MQQQKQQQQQQQQGASARRRGSSKVAWLRQGGTAWQKAERAVHGHSAGLGVGLRATLGAGVALNALIFLGVLHVVVSADCRFIPREIFWLAPTWCWCWSGYVNIGALVIIRFRQILVERRWEEEREHRVVVDVRGHRTQRRRRNRRSKGSRRHWRSQRSRRRGRRRRLWWLGRVW